MSDIVALTAAQAAAAVEKGDLDRRRAVRDLPRPRGGRRPQRVRVGRRRGRPPAGGGNGAGRRPPLGGVPLGVKDLFCTEGVPSQAGSRILEGYRPPYTATVVRKLAEAGAPLLGKTNQDEFAMGSSNENSAFGPVLNPWDRARVPGGSSGGSAAAVAAGIAPWAIGTDTGGSIRQPAALCGIVGLKPTYGVVQPLRDDRVRLVARPGGPAHPRRHRRRAAVRPHGRPRRPRRDLDRSSPRRSRRPTAAAPRRHPPRRAGGPHRRGRRARRHGARSRPRCRSPATSARPSSASRSRTPTTG